MGSNLRGLLNTGNLRWIFRIVMIVWVVVVVLSHVWDGFQAEEAAVDLATVDARSTYNKDLVYRRWASLQGGVYVKASEKTPPNPYLSHIPHRDITNQFGENLTLVNPAYMTRQVHELGHEQYGYQGHITSLNPLRPENKPDPWEEEVLKNFQQGTKETTAIAPINGEPHLRFMRAMITEESCLKCHGSQGYTVGEVRGGVSVSVPMKPYLAIAENMRYQSTLAHISIGILGLFGLWLAGRMIFRSQRALEKQQKQLELALHGADLGAWDWNLSTGELVVNRRWLSMLGYRETEMVSKFDEWKERIHPDDFPVIQGIFQTHINGESESYESEHRLKHKNGEWIWVLAKGRVIERNENGKAIRACGTHLDITQRKQNELENQKLEEKLRQAQKLESVGRLAGGIAHDFNNLLTTITGNVTLAIMDLPPDDELMEPLNEVNLAATRAANLTRQLLAFSRKQVIQPKVIDLNELIQHTHKMLVRLIGEDVELKTIPLEGLGRVLVDPGHMEQILLNLAVNARDAMPQGGTLFIETGEVELNEEYAEYNLQIPPGRYVMLAVSDTGTGMTEETKTNIFDPFFTTKEAGKGTGLGLATVYGIVKQSQGSIQVYSELGKGSTFKVYLPVAQEGAEHYQPFEEVPFKKFSGGTETILVVEDERSVGSTAIKILKGLGYQVQYAENGVVALGYLENTKQHFDVLLTDIVMPKMNGRELAQRFVQERPNIKVIYTSGYTENVISHQNRLDEGVHFLGKPYSPQALAKKIREALDSATPTEILH